MGKVRDILNAKGNNVYAVEPAMMVYHAVERMCEKNIGALLIVDEGKLVGIFTERDYARKLILKGKSSKTTLISELMTPNPITVTPEHTVDECMTLMTGKFIRHLPVVENDRLIGLVSIGDVVKLTIEEQKDIIEYLENYISR
jgi:CBS domain-containing protein